LGTFIQKLYLGGSVHEIREIIELDFEETDPRVLTLIQDLKFIAETIIQSHHSQDLEEIDLYMNALRQISTVNFGGAFSTAVFE